MRLENDTTGKILNKLNKACVEGDIITFQQIIPEGALKASPLTLEYILRGSSLRSLLEYDRIVMLDYLFDQGLVLKDISPGLVNHLRFLVAENKYQMVLYLIKKGVSISRIIKDTMMEACQTKSLDMLNIFIENGLTIDMLVNKNYGKVCESMLDIEMYHKFIEMGFNAEHINNEKDIFSYICVLGDQTLLENICSLVKDSQHAEAIVKTKSVYGYTALRRCIMTNHMDSAETLLRNFHYTYGEKQRAALPEALMDIQYEEPLGPKFAAFGI